MNCRFCGAHLGQPVIIFKDFPIYSGSTEQGNLLNSQGRYFCYDFGIAACPSCSLIQQYSTPDLNVVYAFKKNEGVGEKWRRHYEAFAQFIAGLAPYGKYLEIGSGNLKLANIFWEKGYRDAHVCDVNTSGDKKFKFFKGFFEEIDFNSQFDFIYSSHVFEHISDFYRHVAKINGLLRDSGYYFISLPNFKKWIEGFYLNAFVQDHIVYPFKEDIEQFMRQNGLSLKGEDYFEDHSIFLAFQKSNGPLKKTCQVHLSNTELLYGYRERIEALKEFLKQRLGICNKRIYIFGAHVFSQILLALDVLPKERIAGIFDNAELKQGKFLYPYDYLVSSPKILSAMQGKDAPVVIVFAGAYEKEIIAQLMTLNPRSEIICSGDFLSWQNNRVLDNA